MSAVPSNTALCVDLDGTLIKTDLLMESSVLLAKKNPFTVFLLPFWLMRGRFHLKDQIVRRVEIHAETLPYRKELLEFLKGEHSRGRPLVLATATHRKYADQVAEHLGIFSEVFASSDGINLSGGTKREALLKRFGKQGFAYVGNSAADFAVWEAVSEAYLVSDSPSFAKKAARRTTFSKVFQFKHQRLMAWIKALRVHQWVKNTLLFVPWIAGHRFGDGDQAWRLGVAFFAFCSVASSVYLVNDLLDIQADRSHPKKRHRPIASGALPMDQAALLAPILLALGIALSARISFEFLAVLGLYFAITLAYSLWIKRMVLADVMVLAGLYSIRIFAGSVATGIPISNWLLAFSGSLFLSLALAKRCSELIRMMDLNRDSTQGRGYIVKDLSQISSFGSASALSSVLVFAFYINSKEVLAFYAHPERLWLLCPVIFYWLGRVWILANRGRMHDDPIVFALRDRVSHGLLVASAIIFAYATR